MKVSYNWLNSYFKKGLFGGTLPKPEKLGELFNLHFAEVEGIEKVSGDTVIEVKTLADRNHYALCHCGIAGEASAILGKPLKPVALPQVAIDSSVATVSVNVGDSKLCPRYMSRRVNGVTVGPSPKQLTDRLEAIGARSINGVVDATNYVMFDIGQPLHAFDADKVRGGISVRLAKAGEKMTLLDGREVELKDSDLVIADDEGPLAIAGVKGGKRAEVTAETKNLILEAATFNSTTVRRTATRANVRNDSSKRFENEITPHIAAEALERVTALIIENAGGTAGPVTDIYPNPAKAWKIEVDPAYINAVTGLNLNAAQIGEILKRLQCAVDMSNGKLVVAPPLERLDLTIQEDIADEVVRMYGYDKLESKQTADITGMPSDKAFYWSEKIKNILVDAGFSEVQTYSLVQNGHFEVAYPLASDKASLRENIVLNFSNALGLNSNNAALLNLDFVKMFEIGKVFLPEGERVSLCIGISDGQKKIKGQDINKQLEQLFTKIGFSGFSVEEKTPKNFFFGKPKNLKFGQDMQIIEINLGLVISHLPDPKNIYDLDFKPLAADKKYKSFSPYPYIIRDIALFANLSVSEVDVLGVIRGSAQKSAGELLVQGPRLFDRFEKEGKVSYAFRMVFQSFEKTLSDDEANAFMAAVYDAVKAKGWEVR